jgi:FG-GAP repeat
MMTPLLPRTALLCAVVYSVSFFSIKVEVQADNHDARAPITIDSIVQVAKLTASDSASGDLFGGPVATSADGRTIVAGARYNSTVGYRRGAAYVFVKGAGGWSNSLESAKLTASDAVDNDLLGLSVAISGDGNTVVVGAPYQAAGGTKRGAAYIFVKGVGGWSNSTQTAKLTASDGADNDILGFSVAISADGSTVFAGAPGQAAGGTKRGAVYVFMKGTGSWSDSVETAKLTASGTMNNEQVGFTLATSADGRTVVAGAPNAVVGESFRGAVYVFVQAVGKWGNSTQTARLTASDSVNGDGLGFSVAVSADGNTAAAGAPNQAVGGYRRGAVYVFVKNVGGWSDSTQVAKLTASDGADSDLLNDCAVSADGGTVFAGAAWQAAGGYKRGAVYVFVKGNPGWSNSTQISKLTASTGSDNDVFSYPAVSADSSTVVVGAPGNTGAVYVYNQQFWATYLPFIQR